jgi:hypothetical protein
MKKSILLASFASSLLGITSFAQVSVPTNSAPGAATNYVGWDATRLFPLTVSHKGNFPINFETNGTERMRLTPTGELGVGTSTPASLLHLTSTSSGNLFRTNGPNNVTNQWQLFTNNQKFRVFVPANSSEANLEAVQAAGYLNLNTAGGTNTAYPNIKLRIFPDDTDRMVAFENPFLSSSVGFMPDYNAKFIINNRNELGIA